MTDAHDQNINHSYRLHYPQHAPRQDDPYYKLFEAFHKAHRANAKCEVGSRGAKFFVDCKGGLELHHRIIEFALINEVDLETFKEFHPDINNETDLEKWAESEPNFEWLCMFHHRGHAGVHVASASDFENSLYIPGLIS